MHNTPSKTPGKTLGLRHLALYCTELEACRDFYTQVLGMEITWQPDADNIYLTSAGQDNLALHRAPKGHDVSGAQRLDHLGIMLATMDEVNQWYAHVCQHNVTIHQELKTHRDGARSFYCKDPDGNIVQMIFEPNVAKSST